MSGWLLVVSDEIAPKQWSIAMCQECHVNTGGDIPCIKLVVTACRLQTQAQQVTDIFKLSVVYMCLIGA